MKPINQTILGCDRARGVVGNCFQAAIASVLELPLEEVPHFVAENEYPWDLLAEWLSQRGMVLTIVPITGTLSDAFAQMSAHSSGYYLLIGQSVLSDLTHVVVCRGNPARPLAGRAAHAGSPDTRAQPVNVYVAPAPAVHR